MIYIYTATRERHQTGMPRWGRGGVATELYLVYVPLCRLYCSEPCWREMQHERQTFDQHLNELNEDGDVTTMSRPPPAPPALPDYF